MRKRLSKLLIWVWFKSLTKAFKEQKLFELKNKLEKIVPDIIDQYTNFKVDSDYLKLKVRGLHAFQISLVAKVIDEFKNPTIVDIGDSAGTHLQYINDLFRQCRGLSVNLDPVAVEKIKAKGLEAIQARAENLDTYNIRTDIFLCFETMEHLMNPWEFLHELSIKTQAKYLIITVPYVKHSRVGLHHLRNERFENVRAENTHLLELNPQDWKLVVKHSGWRLVDETIYRQYPRMNWLRLTQCLWKKYDFEGFYGLILTRDDSYAKLYQDW